MRLEDYTKNQQKAIKLKDKNIIISAGAGSGKTQVLTQRVAYFIQNEGYNLDDFLILTFTKLAALEMKSRIHKLLQDINSSEANNINFAKIMTFDAYALSLVKKYHFLLKIDANVSIVESNIIDVKKRVILKELFNEEYEKKDTIFLKYIERFCFKDDIDIENLFLSFYNKSLLQINTNEYFKSFLNRYNEEFYNEVKTLIFQKLNDFKQLINQKIAEIKDLRDSNDNLISTIWTSYFDSFLKANSYDEYLFIYNKATPKYKLMSGYEETMKASHNNFKKDMEKIISYINGLPKSESDFINYFEDLLPFIHKMIAIIKKLDQSLLAYKQKYNVYEYQDIAKMAYYLIKDNKEIKENLIHQFKMIMVDEYQDTSILQNEFINLLENNNLYLVGDIKQSIYRFRDARCDLFLNRYNLYKQNQGGVAIDLNTNFRSRKEVLEDINYLFKQLMTMDTSMINYKDGHQLLFGNKNYLKIPTNNNYHADYILYADNEKDKAIEARLIASDIINKINQKFQVMDTRIVNGKKEFFSRDCTFNDFTILIDRGNQFMTYAKVFSEFKIPLYIEQDENITQNEIILVLTNLLKLIKFIETNDFSNQEFKMAFISVARSFIFKLTDEQLYLLVKNDNILEHPIIHRLKNIINQYGNLSVYDLFFNLVFDLDIYQKLITLGNIEKNEKYLDTFLSLLKTMTKLDYTLNDLLLYLKDIDKYHLQITLSSTHTSLNSVRLMNIHKSKGLEFNIIYYAGLDSIFNQIDITKEFNISDHFGLIVPPEGENKINFLVDFHKDVEYKLDIAEKVRLFYVALTRAREKMIFVLKSTDYPKYLGSYNEACFNEYIAKLKDDLNLNKEMIYLDYINKKINFDVFCSLFEHLKLMVPIEYAKLDETTRRTISFEKFNQLCNSVLVSDEIINKIKNEILNDGVEDSNFNNALEWAMVKYNLSETSLMLLQNSILKELKQEDDNLELPNMFYVNFLIETKKLLMDNCISIDSILILFDLLKLDVTNFLNVDLDQENYLNLVLELSFLITLEEGAFIDKVKNIEQSDFKNDILKVFYVNFGTNFEVVLELLIKYYYLNYYELFILLDLFKKIGLNIKENLLEMLKMKDENVFAILNNIYNFVIFSDEIIDYLLNEDMIIDTYINFAINSYKEGSNSIFVLSQMLADLNLEFMVDFLQNSDSVLKLKDLDEFKANLVKIGVYAKTLENKFLGFLSLIEKDLNNTNYIIDLSLEQPHINFACNIKQNELILDEVSLPKLEITQEQIKTNNSILTSKENLDFGIKMHSLMETLDFNNPSFDLLNPDEIVILKRFLNSSLVQNLKNGSIYKEYEYFDEVENHIRIIDLMIIYDNYIDIIDYKTKNLDDISYIKQLTEYKKFIERTFNKSVNTYLYSLLTGEVKEIK